MPNANQTLSAFRGANLNAEMFGTVGDGVADNWSAIRAAVAATIKVNGCLTFPRGRFRVIYDAGDATRTSSTGLFDFSPWFDGSNWQAVHNIEIKFDEGAEIFMDCLLPNGYDAQTHCFYARCRWEDIGGAHTPTVWNGYAVGFHSIRIINPRVVWALGSQRGIGDTLRFTGTKSRATAPYGITVENLYAENAPQVSSIFCGCRKVDVWNVHAKSCYADTVHFNACWEGCSVDGVLAEDCGDDTVGAVTYYPDVLTLVSGPDIDTEVGPFTSPDQFSANNNGLKISNVTKIGGSANAVRVQGGYNVVTDTVVADANGSGTLGAAYWAGSVLANGTTLAQSSMANVGCRATNITAENGVQVGVHLVAQGFVGNEGDDWLLNDTAVSDIHATECAQLSVWGHDCYGFKVDDIQTDSIRSEFTGTKDIVISNSDMRGDLVIRGTAVTETYKLADMTAMPWHNITLSGGKITGAKLSLEEIRGIVFEKPLLIVNSPGAAFEAVRVIDPSGKVKIVNPNRSATVDLAHIPARLIPVHNSDLTFDIKHDSTLVKNFLEVGGGNAYNRCRDVRIGYDIIHSVPSGLVDPNDPIEIESGGTGPLRFYRRGRTFTSGAWHHRNTDDRPLPIQGADLLSRNGNFGSMVSEAGSIGAWLVARSAVSGGGYLLCLGLNCTFDGSNWVTGTDGVTNGGAVIAMNYADGNIQFYAIPNTGGTAQTISNASLITYRKAVVDTSGDLTLAGMSTSRTVKVSSGKLQAGGPINVTSSDDVIVAGLTDQGIVIRNGTAFGTLAAFATGRILGTNDSTGLPEVKDVDLGNSAHVTVPGSHGDLLYNNGGVNVAAITLASFITTLRSTLDGVYAPLVHTHAEGDVTNLLSDLGALDSAITGLGSGKADHGSTSTDSGHFHSI